MIDDVFNATGRGTMDTDVFKNIPLSEVCALMVDDSGRPLKAIAAEIGKGYSTLYRELDANDDSAKLGVDTLFPLIRACMTEPFATPPTPLLWLATRCGFKNVPLRGNPDHDDVRDEILDVLHSLDNFTSAIRAKRKSPADVLALARALQKEIDDVVEQYNREW